MITFWFENGAVLTLRNSGTEPKLKYYLETYNENSPDEADLILKDMVDKLIKLFIEPERHDLKPKE